MSARRLLSAVLLAALVAILAAAVGCSDDPEPDLVFGDLTHAERLFVERVIILERARAVALQDRETGDALLDSLATAWGDSSLAETARGMPDDPQRAARVGRLLTTLLAAEQDSLVSAASPRRLTAPLPVPPVPVDAEAPSRPDD